MSWRDLGFDNLKIYRRVAEFILAEEEPFSSDPSFQIKIVILENKDGDLSGYCNVKLKNIDGNFINATGFGSDVEEVLYNVLDNHINMIKTKETWEDDEFEYLDTTYFS